jgi:hypothetical protein
MVTRKIKPKLTEPLDRSHIQAMLKTLVDMEGYKVMKKMSEILVAYNGGSILPVTKEQKQKAYNADIMRKGFTMLWQQVESGAEKHTAQPQPVQQMLEAITRPDAIKTTEDAL